jgi:dUTP pyrophosphatase
MTFCLRIKLVHDHALEFYKNTNTGENAGFDLFFLTDVSFKSKMSNKIDFGIQCEMIDDQGQNVAYWLMPRSSIVKTSLRMSNSMGLIDAGYRGNILAFVDRLDDNETYLVKGSRMFQIVAPNLKPFNIEIVKDLSSSIRAEGGFGSTGQ